MAEAGETDLNRLIQSMQPQLHDPVYVFTTVPNQFDHSSLQPLMVFLEAEGTTLILPEAQAATAGLTAEFSCRMITLNIHSSLDAVGFLARITQHLAKLGMGVNPVSGFYHDHLFVPASRADEALAALFELTETTST